MANLFGTGFEGITSGQLSRRGPFTSGQISTSYGRFGQGWRVQASGLTLSTPHAPTSAYVGVAFTTESIASGSKQILAISGPSGNHVTLNMIESPQRLQLVNASGAEIGTFPITTPSVWNYVELGLLVISNTVGEVVVKLNGVSVISSTTADTLNAATATISSVFAGNASNGQYYFDDLYINDGTGSAPHNTFYGEVRFDRVDTAADSSVQFTPSAGTNESCIDDGNSPDDDTTYNQSSTAGHKDAFTVSGYTAPSGTILGVFVRSVARKTDAGARTFNNVVTSGATTVESTPVSLSTSYIEHTQALYTDPNTGVAWANAAAINAMLIGYEIDT